MNCGLIAQNMSMKKISYCDFCDRPSDQVGKLIEGPGSEENREVSILFQPVFICSACITSCMQVAQLHVIPNDKTLDHIKDEVIAKLETAFQAGYEKGVMQSKKE